MTHDDLIPIAKRWLEGRKNCGFVFTEFYSMTSEIPDAIGFQSYESWLVECKASRADFLSDKKKPHRIYPEKGMGRFRYYMCPTDLISVEELPKGWGLIYVNDKGKYRCVVDSGRPKRKTGRQVERNGKLWPEYEPNPHYKEFDRNIEAELRMMYTALRRIKKRGLLDTIYDIPQRGNIQE